MIHHPPWWIVKRLMHIDSILCLEFILVYSRHVDAVTLLLVVLLMAANGGSRWIVRSFDIGWVVDGNSE